MSEISTPPRLVSDFDGTAVKKYGWHSPRNWLKYPLPGIPGYLDFISGVQEEGVGLEGIATIRKKWLRQRLTNRSLKQLGYLGVIDPDTVEYAGNERAKGQFIVARSLKGKVGMIDDNPHKIGREMLGILAERTVKSDDPLSVILLGAVAHSRTLEHIEELAVKAETLDTQIEEIDGGSGMSMTGEGFKLDVVELPPYSVTAGMQFAQRLIAA